MAIETDFAQILERLENKIDAQGEKLQSMDTRLARVEEKTDSLSERLEKIEGNIERQDNRLWTYLATTTVTLLGSLLAIVGRFLLFPNGFGNS
ncbi:MAG: hypothetical protein ACLFTJ_11380 [Halothece sp.]